MDRQRQQTDKVAEYNLTLEYPGRWILTGYNLPWGLWYIRQQHAMNFAAHRASDCSSMIVRLRNQWSRKK